MLVGFPLLKTTSLFFFLFIILNIFVNLVSDVGRIACTFVKIRVTRVSPGLPQLS